MHVRVQLERSNYITYKVVRKPTINVLSLPLSLCIQLPKHIHTLVVQLPLNVALNLIRDLTIYDVL